MNMRKRVLALMLAVGMVLTGCGGNKTEEVSGPAFTIEKDNETVAEISEEYAWLDALFIKDTYESFFGEGFFEEEDEDGVTYGELFKEELLYDLKMRKVVVLEAETAGITLTDEEKDICKENAASYIEEITAETLELTGIDEETLAEYEIDYAIYEKYEEALMEEADVTIDIDDVRQSDLFVLSFPTMEETEDGEEVEVDEAVKAEIKKEADAAYAMLQSGKTMEEVAEANDMDPDDCMWVMGKTAEEDQDEYYDAAFENAAFSLEEGEYSEVIEGIDGYYIIQMVTWENDEETAAAMEEAEEAAASDIFYEKLDELMESYEVTMNDGVWDKIDFTADIAFTTEEEYYEEDTSEEYEDEEYYDEDEYYEEEEIETEG